MKLYIKGYYGYKNIGDELLLIGLINFFTQKYNPEYIYIQAGDKQFLSDRISKNQSYIKFDISKIEIVSNKQYIYQYYKFRNCHKIIGGGECISPVAKFPNGGRKYIIRFRLDIINGNYTLCGGIGTPNQSSKLLYRILLGRARNIIVRDPESQNISLIYNKNTELYHDFAIDVINIYLSKVNNIQNKNSLTSDKSAPYILLNLKQSESNPENISLIKAFISKYPNHKYVYIANFLSEDMTYEKISQDLGISIDYYDWTDKSLDQIFELFDKSDGGRGVRLHFLMILKTLGKHYEYIYYQEKIKKLIG